MSNPEERSVIGDSICGLIAQARDGSTAARDQLLVQLRSYVALVAGKHLMPDLRAKLGTSDMVQESMALAVEKFEQFNGSSEAELFAWVKTILENEIKQAKRSFRSEKRNVFREQSMNDVPPGLDSGLYSRPQIADREITPRTFAVKNETLNHVQTALRSLNDDYQKVIQLRNWDKLSFREIGKRMQRSENAVTKLWYRALVALREAMGQIDD